jgi:DNA-binding transcriptional MerR regulator
VQKSAEAFRTISEVADELDVPQHVLRFWESKFTQIKPLKRAGGRRYYRPDDISLLRGIRALLYSDGYTIKGVQKVLKERGARFVTGAVAGVAAEAAKATPAIEPAHAAAPRAPRRKSPASDPDEVPFPIFMPDFLKAPAAATAVRQARAHEVPEVAAIQPAARKKLEKLLDELIAIRGLLSED